MPVIDLPSLLLGMALALPVYIVLDVWAFPAYVEPLARRLRDRAG